MPRQEWSLRIGGGMGKAGSNAAIETLLADLQKQEAPVVRRRTRRTARYRMVIDGPFIETKEFGGWSRIPDVTRD